MLTFESDRHSGHGYFPSSYKQSPEGPYFQNRIDFYDLNPFMTVLLHQQKIKKTVVYARAAGDLSSR